MLPRGASGNRIRSGIASGIAKSSFLPASVLVILILIDLGAIGSMHGWGDHVFKQTGGTGGVLGPD